MAVVEVSEVRQAAEAVLVAAGVAPDLAMLQVDLLVEAELRGTSSHGLLRLERLVHRIRNTVVDPNAKGIHTWRGEGFLSINGQRGLGPAVALGAIEAITARARTTGIAVAAIANNNHLGMLAYYVERIARTGQTAIALTTSEALVHPWGGRQALIGTNPIAIGVPTTDEPFVIDLATSLVSMGEIHDHSLRGEAIPAGWALDSEGNPTASPHAAKNGAIAPFGGAKGYALGLAFEILVTSIAGSAFGREVAGTLDDDKVCNKGDIFIVIDPGTAQAEAVSRYLAAIRASAPAHGFDAVRIPNERSLKTRAERLANGLPLADDVWERICRMAGKLK